MERSKLHILCRFSSILELGKIGCRIDRVAWYTVLILVVMGGVDALSCLLAILHELPIAMVLNHLLVIVTLHEV